MAEVFRNFLAGRQLANQQQQHQNLLAQQGVENERQNQLMQMRQTQFGNEQADRAQQQQLSAQERQRQAAQRSAAIANQALRLGGPDGSGEANARAFLRRSLPIYQQDLALVADDLSDLTNDAIPWEQQVQNLQQLAAFGDMEPGGDQRMGMGNVNPGEYSPESVAAYAKSINPRTGVGDYSLLQRIWAPQIATVAGVTSEIGRGAGTGGGGSVRPLTDIGTTADNAARVESAKVSAREGAQAEADAVADLPRVESNADQMLDALDRLENSNLGLIFGAMSLAPIVPGTPQADVFALWDQVQGKAFMEAFSTLKGGGQITEKEGEKATAAVTRLSNRKQTTESAARAIEELRQIVLSGVERARRKARMEQSPPNQQQEVTATGPNGQKLVLRNGQWVPL